MTHRHPLFCIVPSYMLESIAENGTPAQQEYAMHNLAHSITVREQRAMVSETTATAETAVAALPPAISAR